jgi:tetratricopeptide (TPR) repeat protein
MTTAPQDPSTDGEPRPDGGDGPRMHGSSHDSSTFNQFAGDQYNIHLRPAPPPVTATMPADTAEFTGRRKQLDAITAALMDATGPGGVVAIHAIDGMPGVGKTALAVHAGHLVAARFPDRQLFVDLHGHTSGQQPAGPADVLAMLLTADGVDPRYLPGDVDGRSAMWRGRMAGHRILLILDNAASGDQVAPLLPGSAQCLVLVTSRRYLGDLPASVAEVRLDILPPDDARTMFVKLAPRAVDEPAQVAELVGLCGHLPLAISLMARLFTRHESWTISNLIEETRARLLTVTAESRTIAAAFELSYQYLPGEQQHFLRHLGVHPGSDIDAYAAAALSGLPLRQAAGHLDALHGDRLLDEPVARRYRMHDLIRQYASSLTAADSASERERAAGRLLDYYQHTAEAAATHLARYTRPAPTASVPMPEAAPRVAGRDQAHAWMTTERANLMACIDYAASRHQDARVVGLTAAIASHLYRDGPWPQAIDLHAAAAPAAQRLGDQPGEANALLNLGSVRRLTADFPGAAAAMEHALDISRDLGDQFGASIALLNLGSVRRLTGDLPGATAALEQALDISRDLGNRICEANALSGLGEVQQLAGDLPGATTVLEQALDISRDIGDQFGVSIDLLDWGEVRQASGDFPGATTVLEQALDISRDLGDQFGVSIALINLGDLQRQTGDLRRAAAALEQGLEISRDLGHRLGEAIALSNLGALRHVSGDFLAAAAALEQALEIFRDLGDRLGEAGALNRTGTMHLSSGDPRQARAQYRRALELARTIGSRLEEARALEGIGKCARTILSPGAANDALREALQIYQLLGAADAVRLAAEVDNAQRA